MTNLKMIEIGPRDVDWHRRFADHVLAVFEDVDFTDWAKAGNWTDRYSVFAMVENETMLASIGCARMRGVIGGKHELPMIQLGSVATRVDRRGEGLSGRLMEAVLNVADREKLPILLFANETVLDFYPRYGFTQRTPNGHSALVRVDPGRKISRRLDPGNLADRAVLHQWVERATPHGSALSARADASTILWYLYNSGIQAHLLPDDGGIVFFEQLERHLYLADWLSADTALDLNMLAGIVSEPSTQVDFGFIPDLADGSITVKTQPAQETYMFWRGPPLPAGDLHFPELMVT